MNSLRTQAAAGRTFFGLALVAFGVQQFIYGDFIPGRAPAWPEGLPGQLAWAYVSGLLFASAGLAMLVRSRIRPLARTAVLLILVWALLRHVPALISHPSGVVITFAGKALALTCGTLAIGESSPNDLGSPHTRWTRVALRTGAFGFGAFITVAGIQHFLYARFVAQLVPAWIPAADFWTYFTGVALVCGGVGLQIARLSRLAGTLSGLMILTWVVTLHLPRALAAVSAADRRNEWTAVFEALAFAGVALFLGATLRDERAAPRSLSKE